MDIISINHCIIWYKTINRILGCYLKTIQYTSVTFIVSPMCSVFKAFVSTKIKPTENQNICFLRITSVEISLLYYIKPYI